MSLKFNTGFYINAGKTEKASFDIVVKYEDLEKAVANYTQKEDVLFTINLVFDIVLPDLLFLPKTTLLTYTVEKTLPALKPEFSIKNIAIIVPPKADIGRALLKVLKRILVSARMRTNVKRFEVICIKELPDYRTEITAVLDPLTSVDCLAVQADSITVEGIVPLKLQGINGQ